MACLRLSNPLQLLRVMALSVSVIYLRYLIIQHNLCICIFLSEYISNLHLINADELTSLKQIRETDFLSYDEVCARIF